MLLWDFGPVLSYIVHFRLVIVFLRVKKNIPLCPYNYDLHYHAAICAKVIIKKKYWTTEVVSVLSVLHCFMSSFCFA